MLPAVEMKMTKTLAMMPMVKSLIPLRDDFKDAATAACVFPHTCILLPFEAPYMDPESLAAVVC